MKHLSYKSITAILTLLFITLVAGGCQMAPPQPGHRHTPAGPVISAIEADIAANRLTRPTGNNALEKLKRLALISPDSPQIARYRSLIVGKLVSLGQQAFMDKQYYRAKVLALRALKLDSDYPEAGYILDAVREAQQPPQHRAMATEIVDIEKVETPASVGIITVTLPDLQDVIVETPASTPAADSQ